MQAGTKVSRERRSVRNLALQCLTKIKSRLGNFAKVILYSCVRRCGNWTTLLNWTLNACGFEGRKSMATGCFTVSLCDLSFVYSVESREPATKTGQATRTSQGDMKGPGLKSSRTTELGTVRKQSAMRRHATRVPNVLFLVCGNPTYKQLQNA